MGGYFHCFPLIPMYSCMPAYPLAYGWYLVYQGWYAQTVVILVMAPLDRQGELFRMKEQTADLTLLKVDRSVPPFLLVGCCWIEEYIVNCRGRKSYERQGGSERESERDRQRERTRWREMALGKGREKSVL